MKFVDIHRQNACTCTIVAFGWIMSALYCAVWAAALAVADIQQDTAAITTLWFDHLSLLMHVGTGGNPELGEQAAQESYADLGQVVEGADMVRRF